MVLPTSMVKEILTVLFQKRTDNHSNTESSENHLGAYRCSVNETVLVNTSSENEFLSIAPGENVTSESLLNDKFCEKLSHPILFQTGKFGFQFKIKVELSPTKYFNQRLLNYAQKLSSDSDYSFFAHSVIQEMNLNNEVNIAMRKVASNQLTAGMLNSNFNENVMEFITRD